ncbi:hypothetical protein IQ07DRAFT_251236 [Pyrenochaeta sp. DS3sAY3a]|nr:hypothetical protein IQ07DRAFT_251236 [Pyrenochaeta sp. DS3sAY3a]
MVSIIFFPIAITLSELVSVYPTVGGQYHWTGILAPTKYQRQFSYACGYLSWFSWLALAAAGCGGLPNYIVALIGWYHPTFVVKRWHVWIIYECTHLINFLVNAFASSSLSTIYKAGFALSTVACFTIFTATLASAKEKRSSSFVWTQVDNVSGWPNTIQFLISLSGPSVMFCAIDGVVHLAEDTKKPAKVVPKAILMSLTITVVISFAFALATLYCLKDFEAALNSPTKFPIFEIWRQAMDSDTWAVSFIMLLVVISFPVVLPLFQIVSRMTWSLAHDDGLLFSNWLKKVDEKKKIPFNALCFNSIIIFLIGCLYLISTTAFLAILTISVVLQQVTLAAPSAMLLYRRRNPRYLPTNRPFKVPNAIGWACNIISVLYAILAAVFFQFPFTPEVTWTNMNYCSLVVVLSCICGLLTWFIHARNHYHPPKFILSRSSGVTGLSL